MRLSEIANSVEQQRLKVLKNSAERAKRAAKDAEARAKIRKAREQLLKSRGTSLSNYSSIG